MRIITLHCDYIKFKALKKAIKNPEELSKERQEEIEVKDPLVVLTAVEKGDDEDILKKYIDSVKKTAEDVKAKNLVLYPYAHLSSMLSDPETALKYLSQAENSLSEQGFIVSRAPFGYYKEFELKCKGHPLSELSKEFRTEEQITKSNTEKPKKKEQRVGKIILDRRNLQPNDHRILGEDLEIFHLSDEIGPGLPLWLPKGEIIRHQLEMYMREIEESYGYKYVSTPHITKGHLYEKTGHVPYYMETMFPPIQIDGIDYYLKPMNCPHHHMIFNKLVKSYRDLPFKLAEPGLVYRNELSGVTYGLIRVKAITQNDAHIYLEQSQIEREIISVLEMFEEVYKAMQISDYRFRLSLPDFKGNPDKFTGDPESWKNASEEIKKALKKFGKPFQEEIGEAAFYGPKIDVQIKNSQGKEETIATIQIDIVIPEKLDLSYVDEQGNKKRPVIIHRAILGSYERFIAFLLEKTEGKLPIWLSPVQVRVINFTDRNLKSVNSFIEKAKSRIPGLRIDSDLRNTTVNDKIRDAEMQKIPYIIVIGDKEEEKGTIAVRERGSKKPEFGINPEHFLESLNKKIKDKN